MVPPGSSLCRVAVVHAGCFRGLVSRSGQACQNPMEAQSGPLRTFTMGGSDHPNYVVLAWNSRTTWPGAMPTPATPASWPPSAAIAPRIHSERQQRWGRPKPKSA
jgi:hypothetical protein